MSEQRPTPDKEQQHWAEAVIECVSDNAKRERLIRFYNYEELVKACLALGTLALTAKTEYQRAEKAVRERDEALDSIARLIGSAPGLPLEDPNMADMLPKWTDTIVGIIYTVGNERLDKARAILGRKP